MVYGDLVTSKLYIFGLPAPAMQGPFWCWAAFPAMFKVIDNVHDSDDPQKGCDAVGELT